jgi:hydrogenase expression/formation protein HypC
MCLAIPGILKSITEKDSFARSGWVDFGGVSREVNLACLPDAKIGDYIIVHAGVGLQILDEVEAQKILDDFSDSCN